MKSDFDLDDSEDFLLPKSVDQHSSGEKYRTRTYTVVPFLFLTSSLCPLPFSFSVLLL